MEISQETLPNQATVLRCDPGNMSLNSLNIWIEHDADFPRVHVIEHVLAAQMKSGFKSAFPCAMNAACDQTVLASFCRVQPNATARYFQTFTTAVRALCCGELYEDIQREARVVAVEMDRETPDPFWKALGKPRQNEAWQGEPEAIVSTANEVLVGANVTALIVGQLSERDNRGVQEALSALPAGHSARPNAAAPNSDVIQDVAGHRCGLSFTLKAPCDADSPLMMCATKMLTGRSQASLSRRLRAKGLSYKLDRSMALRAGGAQHVICAETTRGQEDALAQDFAEFFSAPPQGLSAELARMIMDETRVYLQLAQENKGVLASRIGKHVMNYGRLPRPDFMTDPFRDLSAETVRDLLAAQYFGSEKGIQCL